MTDTKVDDMLETGLGRVLVVAAGPWADDPEDPEDPGSNGREKS